jgi:hypothetical protein
MTIEERLESISQQLEIITGMQLASERRFDEMEAEHKRLDARERKAREALLSGVAAYLRALQNGNEKEDGDAGA